MRRTQQERRLLERARRLLPAGVRRAGASADTAMVAAEARGARLRDASGNEYVDYLLGSGSIILGHAHPAVTEAIRSASNRGTGFLLVNEYAVELAEKIAEHVPCAEQVTLHSSGSEAVFFALRLARAWRGRDKVLKFEGGFHGMSDVALISNQWSAPAGEQPSAVPVSAGIPSSVVGDVCVVRYNDAEAAARAIRAHHEELAAVLVEPMQRTLVPRPGFLETLRAETKRFGIPLVFDEVVTGFRLGLGGAQAHYGVRPDLCALGKTISAGLPLGAVCGRADILSLADPQRRTRGRWVALTGTYSGNPVSAAAALATISVLEQPGAYERLFATGRRLMQGLERALVRAGFEVQVIGEPPAFEVYFTPNPVEDLRGMFEADGRLHARFAEELLRAGVLKGHEKFFVSLAHGEREVAETLAAFETVARRISG